MAQQEIDPIALLEALRENPSMDLVREMIELACQAHAQVHRLHLH